ncbi:MAG TPA: adenine phosphoribosyltransferase [Vicinamibacteria bacterium]|nr:adenine phosphoribosyltransferase [Vicinamibacteria bacterium]
MERLRQVIRDIPDFPKKGVVFKDITTLLRDPSAFRQSIDLLSSALLGRNYDALVGIESRGFIFASSLAYKLGKGLIPVRKPGKLPAQTVQVSYQLEYGTDSLEMHADAIERGQRVIIVDDVLATGGTARAVAELVEKVGGKVDALGFLVELDFLNGRRKLSDYEVLSILRYD